MPHDSPNSEPLPPPTPEMQAFLRERLRLIHQGVVEGICTEVRYLREMGLPIYIQRGDKVIEYPADEPLTDGCPSALDF